jgi:hypothetical protein
MPRAFKVAPIELVVTPLPTPLMTPPTMKMYLVLVGDFLVVDLRDVAMRVSD